MFLPNFFLFPLFLIILFFFVCIYFPQKKLQNQRLERKIFSKQSKWIDENDQSVLYVGWIQNRYDFVTFEISPLIIDLFYFFFSLRLIHNCENIYSIRVEKLKKISIPIKCAYNIGKMYSKLNAHTHTHKQKPSKIFRAQFSPWPILFGFFFRFVRSFVPKLFIRCHHHSMCVCLCVFVSMFVLLVFFSTSFQKKNLQKNYFR